MKNKKSLSASGMGFSLVELLVVISIIGIMATVIMVRLDSGRKKLRTHPSYLRLSP